MSLHASTSIRVVALACATLGLGACGSGGNGGGDGEDGGGDADDAPAVDAAGSPATGPMDVVPANGGQDALPIAQSPVDVPDPSDDPPGAAGENASEDAGENAGDEPGENTGTATGPIAGPTAGAVGDEGEPANGDPVPDDVPPAGTTSRFGVLAVTRGGAVDAEAGGIVGAFYGLDAEIDVDDVSRDLSPAADTCAFDPGGGWATVVGVDIANLDALGFAPLSAGETIVVSGPGGTFATLVPVDTAGSIVYAPEGGTLPVPVPAGLVADIPGDGFPAFADVRLPDAPALTGVSPATPGAVDVGATFTWDAGGDDSARVQVTVTIDGTDPVVSVSCSATDDGEFRLPASLLARIPDGRPVTASLARVVTRTLQRGGAVLLVVGTAGAER